MLPVSVNGLGLREATFSFYFTRLGLPIESAVLLSLMGARCADALLAQRRGRLRLARPLTRMPAAGRDTTFIQETYWIVLGRAATATRARRRAARTPEQRPADAAPRDAVVGRIPPAAPRVAGRPRDARRSGGARERRSSRSDRRTSSSGAPTNRFSAAQPDEGGARPLRERLWRPASAGPTSSAGWRSPTSSSAAGAPIPRDTQLCELANPAKWDNEEWLDLLRSLGLSDDKLAMHRKPYEFTQLLYGCRRLGRAARGCLVS